MVYHPQHCLHPRLQEGAGGLPPPAVPCSTTAALPPTFLPSDSHCVQCFHPGTRSDYSSVGGLPSFLFHALLCANPHIGGALPRPSAPHHILCDSAFAYLVGPSSVSTLMHMVFLAPSFPNFNCSCSVSGCRCGEFARFVFVCGWNLVPLYSSPCLWVLLCCGGCTCLRPPTFFFQFCPMC